MLKVLIFGSNGLLGQSLVRRFAKDYEVLAVSRNSKNMNPVENVNYFQVDMINRQKTTEFLLSNKPNIIINAAAFTDVDGCEKDKELCWNTNVRAVENIIDAAHTFSPILVHVSTDYVFDGSSGGYRETDEVNPLGDYARSKMAAENIVVSSRLEYIIARTQVLYGYGNGINLNFATWVVSRLSAKKSIRVVVDQIGNPTYVDDLSESIKRLLEKKEHGLFHTSGSEAISRYDFALKIAKVFSFDASLIEKIVTSELNQIAPRPMNSSFLIDKLVNKIDWEPGNLLSGLQRLKIELDKEIG